MTLMTQENLKAEYDRIFEQEFLPQIDALYTFAYHLTYNEDGSVDLYFGPSPPEAKSERKSMSEIQLLQEKSMNRVHKSMKHITKNIPNNTSKYGRNTSHHYCDYRRNI